MRRCEVVKPVSPAFGLAPRPVAPSSRISPPDPVAAADALKFFAWAFEKGDKMAEELDYVPMPEKVVSEIEKLWAKEIKDAGGKPLYVPSATAQ